MADSANKDLDGFVNGHGNEARRALRRRTFAPIIARKTDLEGDATVTNVSVDGAFVKTNRMYPVGTTFQFKIKLPTAKSPIIPVGGKIVRVDREGFGVRFSDLKARDRSKLREYALFSEMDDTIVRIQSRLKSYLSGNFLPISDPETINDLLHMAEQAELKTLVVDIKGGDPIESTIAQTTGGLLLKNLARPLKSDTQVVYVSILNGPVQYLFEGLVAEHCPEPKIIEPERVYQNERRSGRRKPVENAWMELDSPHDEGEPFRLPLVDMSEMGCAVRASKDAILIPGMRFPEFKIKSEEAKRKVSGATIKRLVPDDAKSWLVGLDFLDDRDERDAFADIKHASTKASVWSSLTRYSSVAKEKIRGLFVSQNTAARQSIVVTKYKNERGDQVAALLDATFDPRENVTDVDVAVVVAPAFLRRKEVFSLLARTLVDNFRNQGINGVVLRFDATHTVGESAVDPELEKEGNPYLRWTFSHLKSDIKASMAHLERRYRPKKRVLVTFSVASMAGRRYIADGQNPPVDQWIVPFGCPDAQDMFQNYLAGIDLFQNYLKGESAEPFLIYGRLADPNYVFPDAMKHNMAFLEQAREDMAKINCPVTWIVGTYDYMVTRERVRKLLNSPGGGTREIFELASGHVLKAGDEAIESFKLISESVAKQIFGKDTTACEPDMAQWLRQNDAEWERVREVKLKDATEFWNRHLFGTSKDREGYDVLLHNPAYTSFINEQAAWMDTAPEQNVADIGCGTGNFSVGILSQLDLAGKPFRLTCMDLVPAAINCTRKKINSLVKQQSDKDWSGLTVEYKVVDLETARLASIREFLNGELYGPRGLAGRIEGLHPGTIEKLAESYSAEMHRILRGESTTVKEIRSLCSDLDDREAETVLELSRLARFVLGKTLAEDVEEGAQFTGDIRSLKFNHLTVAPGNRECRIAAPSDSYDRIGSSLVLSYLYDPMSVVKEYYRILSPGGIMIISSLKQNFDSSKSYKDEAEAIGQSSDLDPAERDRLLDSLREFASFVGCVMELEDEGRFKFFSQDELTSMVKDAGFIEIQAHDSFGDPATAVVLRARKPDGRK